MHQNRRKIGISEARRFLLEKILKSPYEHIKRGGKMSNTEIITLYIQYTMCVVLCVYDSRLRHRAHKRKQSIKGINVMSHSRRRVYDLYHTQACTRTICTHGKENKNNDNTTK